MGSTGLVIELRMEKVALFTRKARFLKSLLSFLLLRVFAVLKKKGEKNLWSTFFVFGSLLVKEKGKRESYEGHYVMVVVITTLSIHTASVEPKFWL